MSTIQKTPSPVAARIKKARREAGLLQRELAEKVGLTTRAVQHWEAGTSEPRGRAMRELAFHTGKTVAWFYEDGLAA